MPVSPEHIDKLVRDAMPVDLGARTLPASLALVRKLYPGLTFYLAPAQLSFIWGVLLARCGLEEAHRHLRAMDGSAQLRGASQAKAAHVRADVARYLEQERHIMRAFVVQKASLFVAEEEAEGGAE